MRPDDRAEDERRRDREDECRRISIGTAAAVDDQRDDDCTERERDELCDSRRCTEAACERER